MFRKMHTITSSAWFLLGLTIVMVLLPFFVRRYDLVDSSLMSYVVQPIAAVLLAVIARTMLGAQHDRMRHRTERAMIVGAVVAVWFVVYFFSGMLVTYTYNAVAASWQSILINIAAFGVTAVAVEYVRHSLMTVAGRRNILWFGVIVSIVLACEYIGLARTLDLHTMADTIKFTVSDIVPAFASSFLLTYLAFNAGFVPQIAYRLGLIAVIYIPPVIPKYDWYLSGIAWLVLAVATYISIDRTRKDLAVNGRHYRHARRAYDAMFSIATVVLLLFMVGTFSYQPKVIMSNSMHPVFSRGSMVIVKKVSAMDVEVGDIVQYTAPGHTTTHRVTKIDFAEDGSGKRVFTTQGDNSPSPDPPVQAKQIVGVIRAQIPYIGYPTVWLNEFMK